MHPAYLTVLISVLEILGIIAALGLLTTVLPYVKAFCKRYFFSRKLGRFCKSGKCRITWLHPFYRSIFSTDLGIDFVLQTEKKTYHVAMLSARYRHREHCIISATEMEIYRKVSVRGIARLRMQEIQLGTSVKTFPIDLTASVPEGEEKILLFYPVPRDVTCVQKTKKVFLGNGDPVLEGFHFFTKSAFWEEVENEGRYLKKRNPWETV